MPANSSHRAEPPKRPARSARTQKSDSKAAPKNLSLETAGFRLLKLTNMMSRPFFGQFAKQHALSLNEWRSIVVLANRPGSAAQDLSQIMGLLPMNISRAVISLRKRGWVEEARDPDNHRRVLLWLTPAGQEMFENIAPYAQAKNQTLFSALNADELSTLNHLLEKLISRAEHITQHGEEALASENL